MAANERLSNEVGRRTPAHLNGPVRSQRKLTTICGERRALMRADAVLQCVAIALEYNGWNSDEPDYPEAIEAARQLISQSIERLESHSASSTTASVRSDSESSTKSEEH
jgi:hypothetical protein